MKKLIVINLILLIACANISLAQDSNKTNQNNLNQKIILLKIKLQAGDFAFAFNLINSVMISPQETDAFLALKKQLQPVVDKITKDNPPATEVFEFEMQLPMANNFLEFLSRSKFPSSEAERYKRVENAFVESAKNVK